jgi:hypothetical protein
MLVVTGSVSGKGQGMAKVCRLQSTTAWPLLGNSSTTKQADAYGWDMPGNTSTSRGESEHYPCFIFPGKDHCGDSSFENQGSDASPLVDDCKQLILNNGDDASTAWTHGTTGSTRDPQVRLVRERLHA